MVNPVVFGMFATFMLIFVRIVGFFVQAPIWGSHHANHQTLVGAALCITILLYPQVEVPKGLATWRTEQGGLLNVPGYGIIICQQFCIGIIMGYISFLSMAVAQFAGELLDVQMGLSVAASFDPASHGASNLINKLKFYIAMVLYLLSNGHMRSLEGLKRSFEVIPVDVFTMSRPLLDLISRATGDIFLLSLQVAAPIIAALIVQVSLGMVARAAPQMNVFMLSFPMNITIGLTLLAASLPYMERMYYQMFDTDFINMLKAIAYMGAGAHTAGR